MANCNQSNAHSGVICIWDVLQVIMSWCRAVWLESNREEEGVVPCCWIEENTVRWPKGSALRLLKQQAQPTHSWMQFQLVKIKFNSGMLILPNVSVSITAGIYSVDSIIIFLHV